MWKNRLFVVTTQTFAVGNRKYFLFCYLAYCFFCYSCVCSSLENMTPRNLDTTFILPHAYLLLFYDAECCFCVTVSLSQVSLWTGSASLACSFCTTSSAVCFSPSNPLGCSIVSGSKKKIIFFFIVGMYA